MNIRPYIGAIVKRLDIRSQEELEARRAEVIRLATIEAVRVSNKKIAA